MKVVGVLGGWISGLESLETSSVARGMVAGQKLEEDLARVGRRSGGDESVALVEIDFFGTCIHCGVKGASGDVLDVEVAVCYRRVGLTTAMNNHLQKATSL